MYLLYSALLAAGLLVSLPYWLAQMLSQGKYRAGLRERLGAVPERVGLQAKQPVIWIHAVSVGEALAVTGVAAELKKRLPNHRLVISTTTDTGQKLARERFGGENVFYFPLDFKFAIQPYMQLLHPELIVLAETEFWPNFLRLAHASGARVAVVNARISDRSWPGYRRFRWLLARVLKNVNLFLAQTAEDARRLENIGAPPERVRTVGNLKYDISPPAALLVVASLRSALAQAGAGPVIVCGSTVEGEEPILLAAFKNVLAAHPKAVMILAPRHPERFAAVAQMLEHLGVSFRKRSEWISEPLAGSVLLLDTIGELSALYALADVAFVGGSLVPRGGHNILEPAQHGVPVLVGNHTENFRDIVTLFQNRDAVRVVGPDEFLPVLMELLSHPEERASLSRRAADTLRSQTGATQKTVDALVKLLGSETPARSSSRTSAGEGARATPST
jgi:3-deoxy-D-manno-octulosonic-acid transferase